MDDPIKNMITGFTGSDDSSLESFFNQSGGKKYLEHISLILINTLPHDYAEKKKLYLGFLEVLNSLEQRIRQKQGQAILDNIFRNHS